MGFSTCFSPARSSPSGLKLVDLPYFRLVRYGAIQPGLKGGNRLFFSVFRFFSNLKESGSIEAEAK
jgi:hypothetical protein